MKLLKRVFIAIGIAAACVFIYFTLFSSSIVQKEFGQISEELKKENQQLHKEEQNWVSKFDLILADTSKNIYSGAFAKTRASTNFVVGKIDNLLSVMKDLEPSDDTTPTKIMITQGNADDLAHKIEFYRDELLYMPIWNDQDVAFLRDSLPLHTFYDQDNARKLGKKNWSEYHFDNVPAIAVHTLLNKFKNNALKSQQMVWERIYQKATSNKSTNNP